MTPVVIAVMAVACGAIGFVCGWRGALAREQDRKAKAQKAWADAQQQAMEAFLQGLAVDGTPAVLCDKGKCTTCDAERARRARVS